MCTEREPRLADQVRTVLLDYLAHRGLPAPYREIDPGAVLADFGLDSLDEVAIVIELESHFNLALDREQAAGARQLRDLVALVARARDAVPQP